MPYNKGEEACSSINLEISQLRTPETQAGFIYRVKESLRNVNSKEYEPDILAIGPYHHGKDRYKMMEEHKLIYLQAILNRNNETTAERYVSAIAELEQKARNCYVEPVNLSEDEFIKMLVLDGCFIIEFLHRHKKEHSKPVKNVIGYSRTDRIFKTLCIRGSLGRDLILFENQIPFFVLCRLLDLIEGPNKYDWLTSQLISFLGHLFPDRAYRKAKNINYDNVEHILQLIYISWVPGSDKQSYYSYGTGDYKFIHSATELRDGNVKFKKRASRASLFEVIFQNGTMLMPPLIIDKDTECFFRNLIAYEQYFPYSFRYVTDYVTLFDYLINSSKDVDVLSECGVIESWLGDNEVIANIINKLKESVVTSSTSCIYGDTFYNINKYYNKRWNRWMAILNRDYFSSPWAYISLFAAFVLLSLTIIQTVCSILQV